MTGPNSFLGWHLQCAYRARTGSNAILISREMLEDPVHAAQALRHADVLIHLAGVNRLSQEDELVRTNTQLAENVVKALESANVPIFLVHANSIHADGDSLFGESKRKAAQILAKAPSGVSLSDVYLPNIFGEHGRPFYNSFVATFCHQIVQGESPAVSNDRLIPLLHAQDAADIMLDLADSKALGVQRPGGTLMAISEVSDTLQDFHQLYIRGEIPDLSTSMRRNLFNTFRSFSFPTDQPKRPGVHADPRGELIEAVRGHGSEVQVFTSTTVPGQSRGHHFHRRKFERFLVIHGQAKIRLQRFAASEAVEFDVDGANPASVDMPTLWAHSITNTGNTPLTTLFFANEVFHSDASDTYPERVGP